MRRRKENAATTENNWLNMLVECVWWRVSSLFYCNTNFPVPRWQI